MASHDGLPVRPSHTLMTCYDCPVRLFRANRTDFIDNHYATWFVRRGEIQLKWAGGSAVVRAGHWVFCDPGLARTQHFDPKTHLISIRILVSWAGREHICPPRPPLAVRARRFPQLFPAAEALVAAHDGEAANGVSARIAHGCRVEARFHAWLARWYAARSKLGRGPVPPGARDPRIDRILAVLRQETNRDPVPYGKLRQACGLSRPQIDRLFNKALQMTPRAWCDRRILAAAERMLGDETLPVKQIAHRLGFADASHFSKWFRQHTRLSPRAFRRGGMV
jgi:AraC-like DNA-binding protein